MAAINVAFTHGFDAGRWDRDALRRAHIRQELAEVPEATRQQRTEEALKVGRVVLPVVHDESNPRTTRPHEQKHIGLAIPLQQFFAVFAEGWRFFDRKSSVDRFLGFGSGSVVNREDAKNAKEGSKTSHVQRVHNLTQINP